MKLEWDFHELFEFSDRLADVTRFNVACEASVKEIAERLHKMLIQNTPVDFGTLKAFWQTNENYSYMVERQSTGFKVTLINRAKYALWVNDGHKQKPGRFIPGRWEGKHFRYDPNANDGMVLKKSWVKGKFFVEISMVQLIGSNQLEKIIYKHLQKWWKECVNG